MTDRSKKRVYHGLRNLPPNGLPSDILSQSRFFNALHDAECPGGSKLVSPDFDAYVARISKEQKPAPHNKKPVANTYLNSDLRTRAFLDAYGVTDSTPVVKNNYGTSKQNRLLSYLYNPDRDTRVLPAGDLDAVAYRFLTPNIVEIPVDHVVEHLVPTRDVDYSTLHTYAKVLEEGSFLQTISNESITQPVVLTSDIVKLESASVDSGFESCASAPNRPERPQSTPRPPIRCCRVQLKIWYTGRCRSVSRKGTIRLGVLVRRRRHCGVGAHCLMGFSRKTSDARNAGYGFNGPGK